MPFPRRILLVEDNPGDARLIRELLREAAPPGHEVAHVGRLEDAVALLAADGGGVVLLDLSLPDAHGLDTVARTLDAAPEVPIVVLTGLDDETLAVQAVKAGAQDYLVKGQVDGRALVRSIRYAVERKRLESERAQLLEREREARSAAEAAVRDREEVLRIVSHDMGNLLSAVKIHAVVLEKTLPEGGPGAQAAKRTGAIRDLVGQMQRLRQDLLDAASIEAGRLSVEPEPLDPEALVAPVVETLEGLAAEKSLSLSFQVAEGLPPVLADRDRVRQLLLNLIGNAVKFTPAGGGVSIRVAPGEDEVAFAVADTGPGIQAGDLEHVFERFWTARRGSLGGAGLGLAISRGIVEAHGGRIWVESRPGAGSTFFFTLPLA